MVSVNGCSCRRCVKAIQDAISLEQYQFSALKLITVKHAFVYITVIVSIQYPAESVSIARLYIVYSYRRPKIAG